VLGSKRTIDLFRLWTEDIDRVFPVVLRSAAFGVGNGTEGCRLLRMASAIVIGAPLRIGTERVSLASGDVTDEATGAAPVFAGADHQLRTRSREYG
jgi:hypothetical protein